MVVKEEIEEGVTFLVQNAPYSQPSGNDNNVDSNNNNNSNNNPNLNHYATNWEIYETEEQKAEREAKKRIKRSKWACISTLSSILFMLVAIISLLCLYFLYTQETPKQGPTLSIKCDETTNLPEQQLTTYYRVFEESFLVLSDISFTLNTSLIVSCSITLTNIPLTEDKTTTLVYYNHYDPSSVCVYVGYSALSTPTSCDLEVDVWCDAYSSPDVCENSIVFPSANSTLFVTFWASDDVNGGGDGGGGGSVAVEFDFFVATPMGYWLLKDAYSFLFLVLVFCVTFCVISCAVLIYSQN